MAAELNLWAAWIGILAGMISGAIHGLSFHDSEWKGGYSSWPRRLMRLGHVSFFGLAFVNFAFVFSLGRLDVSTADGLPSQLVISSVAFIAGAVLMPLVCYLSSWRKSFRRVLFLPVVSLLTGVVNLILWGMNS